MDRRRGLALRAAAPLLAAMLGASAAASAQSLRDKKKELRDIQSELDQRRREIDEYRRREQSLSQELHGLRFELAAAGARRSRLSRQLRQAEDRKTELERQARGLRQAREGWRRGLGARLREVHAARLASSSYYGSDELWRDAWLERGASRQALYIERMSGFESAAERQAKDVSRQRDALKRQTNQSATDRGDRAELIEEKSKALKEARERKDRASARAQELEESAKAMNRLLAELGRKAVRPSREPQILARHSLPWPVDGKVVARFGRREVPELRTWTVQHGIEVQAKPSSPVRSVRPGQVIFAGPFRSYGQVVIVDHGRDLFSLYGRLGGLAKAQGDSIDSGEVLGYAGDTGAMYFEIRRKGDAVDPLAWLKPRN